MPSKQRRRHPSPGRSREKPSPERTFPKATSSKTFFVSSPSDDNPITCKPGSFFDKPNDSSRAIWRTAEPKIRDANAVVLIVGDSQDKEMLNELLLEQNIEKRPISGNNCSIFKPYGSSSTVMVATPDDLEKALKLVPRLQIKGREGSFFPKSLHIIVSRSIKEMTYHISSELTTVTIKPSYATQDADDNYSLWINNSSSYCGVDTWKWHRRSDLKDHSLTHDEGIFFDISNLQHLPFNPKSLSKMNPEATKQIHKKFQSFGNGDDDDDDDDDDDGDVGLGGSTSRGASRSASTDEGVSWFQKYLGLIAGVAGAAVGMTTLAASAHFVWFNAGGFFVKGPLGFYLAGGYFNIAGFGGACLASASVATGAGIAAAGAVYFIPWRKVWNWLKRVLAAIWNMIKDIASWIWEGLKNFATDVASALRQGLTGNAFPHMPRPKVYTD